MGILKDTMDFGDMICKRLIEIKDKIEINDINLLAHKVRKHHITVKNYISGDPKKVRNWILAAETIEEGEKIIEEAARKKLENNKTT